MTSTLATVQIAGSSHGGVFKQGQPRIIVVHSVECPIRRDQAAFRMGLLAARPNASGHYVVDPSIVAAGVDESLIAWGAGSVNPAAIHVEFCGYAAYTRAQWTTTDGLAMLKLGGALIADIAKRRGIPLRWLTDAQLLAAWKGTGPGGLTTHAQCTRVIGGTTHTDPGPNYPTDLLLGYASPKPTTVQEDDMPLSEADIQKVAAATVDRLLNTEIATVDAAQINPKNPTGAWTYKLGTSQGLFARLIRLTGLTQNDIRQKNAEATK